ncbi:MAG: RluA family pseudouridine synthase [Puniceicoccales bacterium]|jgi:23S rRNA pseudouridine1911/1915/1917 synthase|nr:RluA family pseudouridine synthase [Puniceicoccales bacterium]
MAIITLGEGVNGERCDKILSQQLHLPRSLIKASFQCSPFLRNGKPIRLNECVYSGDRIHCEINPNPPPLPQSNPFSLNIIFEDEDILVLNKPAGIAVHPTVGMREKTLVEWVAEYCPLCPLGEHNRPGVVHRLDKDTTGLIIFAKSNGAFNALKNDFAQRRIEKQYSCIVHGVPSLQTGKIEIPIARGTTDRTKMIACPDGKSAKTVWVTRKSFKNFAWLEVRIHSGRTHQIRVHMNHIGHPIGGDRTYGRMASSFIFNRPMLHAESIALIHPQNKTKLSLSAPLPQDFVDTLEKLSQM